MFFKSTLSFQNFLGISIGMGGVIWYSMIKLEEQNQKEEASKRPPVTSSSNEKSNQLQQVQVEKATGQPEKS